MKVLLVNGSPHKDGNTYIALKEVAEQFIGIPATNKKIAITCLNIYRFKGGKIVGEVGMPDLFGLLNQIGAFGK